MTAPAEQKTDGLAGTLWHLPRAKHTWTCALVLQQDGPMLVVCVYALDASQWVATGIDEAVFCRNWSELR